MPAPPHPTRPLVRRAWGVFHQSLRFFSYYYCDWTGIQFDNQICQLPFGLILKWSDGTRVEEVLTMQVARKAGLPVPRVICCGEHSDSPHAPISILMTRVLGAELGEVYETISEKDRTAISIQLKAYLEAIRQWKNPWGKNRICSIINTPIRSVRVPNHLAGPFDSEQEFNDYLIAPAWAGGFASEDAYEAALERATKLHSIPHPIIFSHGDLKHHNIMVYDGRITGFLDWESAGWYPAYWEFTTALRFTFEDFWWYSFAMDLGGNDYRTELECERALTSLTAEAYSW
ncbi:kinase-like protein [Aspergillus heterothallicus]